MLWIKWLDSKGFNGWTSMKELEKAGPCVCESVGYLVGESEARNLSCYVLAPHLWMGKPNGKKKGADGVFVIPAGSVLEVRDLLRVSEGQGVSDEG